MTPAGCIHCRQGRGGAGRVRKQRSAVYTTCCWCHMYSDIWHQPIWHQPRPLATAWLPCAHPPSHTVSHTHSHTCHQHQLTAARRSHRPPGVGAPPQRTAALLVAVGHAVQALHPGSACTPGVLGVGWPGETRRVGKVRQPPGAQHSGMWLWMSASHAATAAVIAAAASRTAGVLPGARPEKNSGAALRSSSCRAPGLNQLA